MIQFLCGIIISYLIGSVPTAYLIGKTVKNIDIRTCGSGNVGATNVFRTVGKKWGVLVLAVDIIKGLCAVLLISRICQSEVISFALFQFLCGVCAIVGHNWPVFLNFKGGKGVATTCGVVLGVFPLPALASLLVFIIVVAVTRYVSLGSISAALLFPVHFWLLNRTHSEFNVFLIFSVIIAVVIIMRHTANIKRLLNRSESKITFR